MIAQEDNASYQLLNSCGPGSSSLRGTLFHHLIRYVDRMNQENKTLSKPLSLLASAKLCTHEDVVHHCVKVFDKVSGAAIDRSTLDQRANGESISTSDSPPTPLKREKSSRQRAVIMLDIITSFTTRRGIENLLSHQPDDAGDKSRPILVTADYRKHDDLAEVEAQLLEKCPGSQYFRFLMFFAANINHFESGTPNGNISKMYNAMLLLELGRAFKAVSRELDDKDDTSPRQFINPGASSEKWSTLLLRHTYSTLLAPEVRDNNLSSPGRFLEFLRFWKKMLTPSLNLIVLTDGWGHLLALLPSMCRSRTVTSLGSHIQ